MPCCASANCASASECETLPQPIGFVGGVNVVVVVVAVPSTVAEYVSVTGVPVRNAVARATALSCEPAIAANGAANLPATLVWPGDSVVVVVAGGVDVPPESPVPPAVVVEPEPVAPSACPVASPASASAIIVARRFGVRLLMISLLSRELSSSGSDQLLGLQDDLG